MFQKRFLYFLQQLTALCLMVWSSLACAQAPAGDLNRRQRCFQVFQNRETDYFSVEDICGDPTVLAVIADPRYPRCLDIFIRQNTLHPGREITPPHMACGYSSYLRIVENPRFPQCLDIMASHRTAESLPPSSVCQHTDTLAAVGHPNFIRCLDIMATHRTGEIYSPSFVCSFQETLAAVRSERFIPCLERKAREQSQFPPSQLCSSTRETGTWFQRLAPWKPQQSIPSGEPKSNGSANKGMGVE